MAYTLTPPEQNDYATRLARMRKWKVDTFRFSIDLEHIRVNKLYRADHDTFEEFLLKEFSMSRSYAYRLIDFGNQKLLGSTAKTEHENRVGKSRVGDKKSDPVFGSNVPNVDEVGDKINEPKKTIDLDKEGHQIPDEILESWNTAEAEFKELMQITSKIKIRIQKAKENDSLIYRGLNYPSIVSYAESLYSAMKWQVPYSVCTKCQGFEFKGCGLCKGRGYIGKYLYDTVVDEDTKILRSKIKKGAK